VIPEPDPVQLQRLMKNPPHWITFTSTSTINHFMAMLKAAGLPFPRETLIAVIGPVTAKAVTDGGLKVAAMANPHTIDGLVAAIQAADISLNEIRKES